MKLFILSGLLVFTATAFSQKNEEFWHDGKVVLTSQDTLKGRINFDIQYDILQIAVPNRTVLALTPTKTLFFEVFDTPSSRYRQFYSMPFANTTGYRVPTFFELLLTGNITLLCREWSEYRNYSTAYYSEQRLVTIDHFYFLDVKGNIEEYSGRRQDLMAKMGKYEHDVVRYIKSNHIDMDSKPGIMRIIGYYNTLTKK